MPLAIFTQSNGRFIVEWFEEGGHVFDACEMSLSDVTALENLKRRFDAEPNFFKRAEMCGMLRLLEDGLTNSYIAESAEVLLRIYDMMTPQSAEVIERKSDVPDTSDPGQG